MPRTAHRLVAFAMAGSLLAGCQAPGTTASVDPNDSCSQYVVQLNSTGEYFTGDILAGAAVGAVTGGVLGGLASGNWRGALVGAAVGGAVGAAGGYLNALQRQNQNQAGINAQLASDLGRENQGLDRTQIAFNQLMSCRFQQADAIRGAVREGRLPRGQGQAQMQALRARTQSEIQVAQTISGRVGTRAAEFDTAVDSVAPGAVASAKSRRTVTARAIRPVDIRLTPDASSPKVAQVQARDNVTLRPTATPGVAAVVSNGQTVGFAETRSFAGAGQVASGPTASGGGDVRSLAASNIARRETFQDSVATASAAASGGGFELAG